MSAIIRITFRNPMFIRKTLGGPPMSANTPFTIRLMHAIGMAGFNGTELASMLTPLGRLDLLLRPAFGSLAPAIIFRFFRLLPGPPEGRVIAGWCGVVCVGVCVWCVWCVWCGVVWGGGVVMGW